ncbi:MAG: biotin transporter BioY [Phycisphaerales bacterium]
MISENTWVEAGVTGRAGALERVGARSWLGRALLAVVGSLLIAAGAQASIPMWPVPITLQTMAVAVVAGLLGWRLGVAAVVLYLVQGALGAPVFAHGSFGAVHLIGPTGGYLLGFVGAAFVIGWLADRGAMRSVWTALPVMLLGDVIVLTVGASWLSVLVADKSFLADGVALFVPGAVMKSACAALIVWRAGDRLRGGKSRGR